MRQLVRGLVKTCRELAWHDLVFYQRRERAETQWRSKYQWRPTDVSVEGVGIEPLLRNAIPRKTDEEFYRAMHQLGCDLVEREYLIYERGKKSPNTSAINGGLVFTQKALDLPSEKRYLAGKMVSLVTIGAAAVVTINQLIDLVGRL